MKKVVLFAALMLALTSYLYAQDTGSKNPSDVYPDNTALFTCFHPQKGTPSDPAIFFKLKNYFTFNELFDKAGFDYTVTKQITHIANSWISFGLITAPSEKLTKEKEASINSEPSQTATEKTKSELSPLIITPSSDAFQTRFLVKKIIPIHTQSKFLDFTIYSHQNIFIATDSNFILLSNRYKTLERCILTISGKNTSLSSTTSYKSTLPQRKATFFQFFANIPRLLGTNDFTDDMLETASLLYGSPEKSMISGGNFTGIIDSIHISSEMDKNFNYLSDTIISLKRPLNISFSDAVPSFRKENFLEITTEAVALNSDLLKNSETAESLINRKLKTYFGFDFSKILLYTQGSINAYIEPSQISADLIYPLFMNITNTPDQDAKFPEKESDMKGVRFPVMVSVFLKKNTDITNMIPENFKKTSFMGYPTYISNDGTVSICHFDSLLLIEKSPGTKGKTSSYITSAKSGKNTLFADYNSFSKNIGPSTIMLSHKNIDAQTSIIKGLLLTLGEDFREEAEHIGRLRDNWSAVMLQDDKILIITQLTSR